MGGLIGMLAFCFVGFTVINRILEGAWITASDVSAMNNLSVFTKFTVFNQFTIPVPNPYFFTQGIPHLIDWDYSFFGGNAAIFQYFLYALTAALSVVFFLATLGVLYNYFGRGAR